MGQTLYASALAWVDTHPVIALILIAAAGLAESLFLIGLFVPGALIMFAVGALMGADALPLGATFAAAIAGSIAGDTASYAFGRRYRGHLESLPGFARVPGLMKRGEDFFARHGGKAVVLGRLVGALRPIIPTVAGAAGLSPKRFAWMDILAATLWAPCYLLPGIVFGASLGLAAQVATRLAILLLVVTTIVWATAVVARYTFTFAQVAGRHYADRLIAWSRHHRRLGLLGPRLADPHQPELPAMAVAAGLLMLVCGAAYGLLWGGQPPLQPLRVDALVFYLGKNLHTPISDGVAEVVAKLGAPLVYLPFAVAMTLTLAIRRHRRAAGLWTAALVFSGAVTLLLRWWLAIPAPVTFFSGDDIQWLLWAGGGQDLILCATVYGLAGMILATGGPPALRPYYRSLTVAVVVLIALARLYLGLAWASDLLIALPLAFIWVNLLVLCYRRQRPPPVRGMPLLAALAGSLLLAMLLVLLPEPTTRQAAISPVATAAHPAIDWPGQGHDRLDARIRDITGRSGAPLNVQAAGSRREIVAVLDAAGWQAPPPLTAGQPLRWLSPAMELADIAVLPRINDGQQPDITRVHAAPPVAGSSRRWVLRLWPSGRTTREGRVPLWVGLVDAQQLDRRLVLFSTAVDQRDYRAALTGLAATLGTAPTPYRRITTDTGPRLLFWLSGGPLSALPQSREGEVDATVTPD